MEKTYKFFGVEFYIGDITTYTTCKPCDLRDWYYTYSNNCIVEYEFISVHALKVWEYLELTKKLVQLDVYDVKINGVTFNSNVVSFKINEYNLERLMKWEVSKWQLVVEMVNLEKLIQRN